MKELIFYYDVICPYAYVASKLIEKLAERTGSTLKWRPVLLGGIYNSIKPKEEAKKRPAETMPPSKLIALETDLRRLFKRNGLTASPHKGVPDLSSLNAMRLIVASPNETSELRSKVTHALYNAVWVDKKDVSDINVLQTITDDIKWGVDVQDILVNNRGNVKEKLHANTEEAVSRGAFGVPSFWVNEQLYFGTDRMFLMERDLGNVDAEPERIQPTPIDIGRKRKLTFYHDVASPWCAVAFRRIDKFLESLKPLDVEIEYVPVLLGALFKEIGTPSFPLRHMTPNRQRFAMKDFQNYSEYVGWPNRSFPSNFPFFSIICQRLITANSHDSNLIKLLYKCAWEKDMNITEADVLVDILNTHGYDGAKMLEATQDPEIKQQLKDNTTRAIENGSCGLPCFQVDDGVMIWGQDRLNVVADLLCGAEDVEPYVQSHL